MALGSNISAPASTGRQLRKSSGARGGAARGGVKGLGAGSRRRGEASRSSRAPPRLARCSAGRASLKPWPPMGEVEPGPAGPLEPPEPPEAAASRRPGGIRVLKVRRQGAGGPCPPSPSCLLPEAAGVPRPASLLHRAGAPWACCGLCAAPPSGPRPHGSPALPILSRRRQAHDFGPPPPPRPRIPGAAVASPGLARGPGADSGGREGRAALAEAKRRVRRARRTPEDITTAREDGGGDWPGAAVYAGCAGWSGHTALRTDSPSSEPAPGSKARHPALPPWGPSRRICCLGTRWACCGGSGGEEEQSS